MQTIGYKLCAIQEVYDFRDYSNNSKFKKFEQFINKLDSWETVKHRIKNLELKYQEMRLYDEIYLEGYSVINDKLEEISFHIYKNKPA
jgi:AAA15 family ATPase/GTPase